jgi:hypothetical protein
MARVETISQQASVVLLLMVRLLHAVQIFR